MCATKWLESLDPGALRVRRWLVWYTQGESTTRAIIEKAGRPPSHAEALAALGTKHVTGSMLAP